MINFTQLQGEYILNVLKSLKLEENTSNLITWKMARAIDEQVINSIERQLGGEQE